MPSTRSKSRADAQTRGVVAERLRAFRKERGLTLSEMSQRSGVSISNLSKIERGEVSPSFDVIFRICDGLDIALEQFVKPGPKEAISGRKTVTRTGDGVPFRNGQYEYIAHSTELSLKKMVPLEMWVRARSIEEFDHWSQHEGEEYVFVISGSIEVNTEHYAPFRLTAGESTYFDSGMRHVYLSVGDGDAHVLSISQASVVDTPPLAAFMQPDAEKILATSDRGRSAGSRLEKQPGDVSASLQSRKRSQRRRGSVRSSHG